MDDQQRAETPGVSDDEVGGGPAWGVPLYPDRYVWVVLLSALDAMLTFVILQLGGMEANPIADFVLQTLGIGGMTIYKFVLITFVILLCEYVGRRDRAAGSRLTVYALILTVLPVAVAVVLLATRP